MGDASPGAGSTPARGIGAESTPARGIGAGGTHARGILGRPRVHLRSTDSTNERARQLARTGAPHGTLVTADEQTAGRGRQGRAWSAPAGSSLLCSLVLRCDPPVPLSLIAAVAVCDAVGNQARVKWPNDVVIERAPGGALGKLAGILVEGRPQERWAVLGIGVNVAVRVEDLPVEVRERAASLALPTHAIEPLLENLLAALTSRLSEPARTLLDAWRARDALLGRDICWGAPMAQGGHAPYEQTSGDARHPVRHGRAEGIDDEGRLLVREPHAREPISLGAGEVHLRSSD